MEEIKVNNLIIGNQFEDSENYQKFLKITKEKNIKVNIVKQGERINIENNLYFDILWPNDKIKVTENILNNNSLVSKLNYNNFSVLFTGDIEEIAEKEIIEKYKNEKGKLQSTIIKIPHHGSKTSSSEEFINTVNAKIALIGVGENNLFNHPSNEIIDRLKKYGIKIYRTDINGEISIRINNKGEIR